MKFVEFVNSKIKEVIIKENNLVIYGQNIDAGSCISGLTSGLSDINKGITMNTPNCENTLTGMGFGLMLRGVSSIFFMKQMDFLLLGIDHLVNTYNLVRNSKTEASYTIFAVNVDSGFEGPQSALNNLSDFCSIAEIDGFCFTNNADTESIIDKYLVNPGFRIISLSQRLMREELIDMTVVYEQNEFKYFQYRKGCDVSIVCFNFSLPYGIKLYELLQEKDIKASLFSVNTYLDFEKNKIFADINATKKVVLIDDTKSKNKLSDKFVNEIYLNCTFDELITLDRRHEKNKFIPRHDKLEIDFDDVIYKIKNACSNNC
jgi:pyruvate/2-oxoglutarate/acetoin dehydrogenase E1 component